MKALKIRIIDMLWVATTIDLIFAFLQTELSNVYVQVHTMSDFFHIFHNVTTAYNEILVDLFYPHAVLLASCFIVQTFPFISG